MELACLPACLPGAAALTFAGSGPGAGERWHPQAAAAHYSEIFAASGDGGGAGACLALAGEALRQRQGDVLDDRPVLWVQEARAMKLAGRPYRPGLPAALRHRVIHVAAKNAADALFALEEGLRCRDLACVIGEFAGNPRALDFTASRRLALAAQKHSSLLFLLRHDAQADLSAARMRWRVRSAPSAAPPLDSPQWNRAAPGTPVWHAQLFRARAHPPGEWLLAQREQGMIEDVGARATSSARTGFGNASGTIPAHPERVGSAAGPQAQRRAHG